MLTLRTLSGEYANPFYPTLRPYRGELRVVDARLWRRRLWMGFLLSALLVAGTIWTSLRQEHEGWMALAVLVEMSLRGRLFPLHRIKVREIQGIGRDVLLTAEFGAHLLALGGLMAVAAWSLMDGLPSVPTVLMLLSLMIAAVPAVNMQARR